MEDEDYVLEKAMGFLPLHHELDSGLGWTDGSFHQGELSGVETEEGLDECHTHQGGRVARGHGGSPSSESFISSELSDSGFYSVSTAEFLRFQRLLEKRMRIYNSRLHHQGELQSLCMEAQKGHRELEAIPETLAVQAECMAMDPQTKLRVPTIQLRKSEAQSINLHSLSSGAIFSTCSSPSSQHRALTQRGGGLLRRSRTMHHRPAQVEQRRRASHPASPNYCSMTLNRCARSLQHNVMEEAQHEALYHTNQTTRHANHPPQHTNHLTHHATFATHHANHLIHPTPHENYLIPAIHPTNHLTHHTSKLKPPEIYITHHANLPPKDPNLLKYTLHHANYTTQPSHATLPVQQTHPIHTSFHNRPAHHGNATLPAQHTHQTRHTRLLHAMSHPSLSSSTDDHHLAPFWSLNPHDPKEASSITQHPLGEEVDQKQPGRKTEGRFHTLAHTPSQSQEGNDTWPKPANRHGPYSTLEGLMTTAALSSSAPKYSVGALTSRALRNQLLRERAIQVADERSGGMSTDDETNMEICRAGRYWSRSERRLHVLQKQRLKRDSHVGDANLTAGSGALAGGGDSGGGYSTLMELSQRKLSRLRNRKLLDDWTTVEELLTHGTRFNTKDEPIPIPNSLLTVTTV